MWIRICYIKYPIFADDTKAGNRADTILQRQAIQSDLDQLFNWNQIWHMDFNSIKWKVLYTGNRNEKILFRYEQYSTR